jgi:8-oxo-dGTP pyrophosphatase MutT (NUDIX family)
MADELVDIVNEQDEVIGITTKQAAHEKRLLHRIAAILVFHQGKILVQKRTAEKNGKFGESVGGHVGSGETYQAAAIREAREEMGLVLEPVFLGKAFGRAKPATDGVSRVSHCYAIFEVELTDEQAKMIKPDSREVEYFAPMTIEEIYNQMRVHPELFTMGLIRAIDMYRRKDKE